MTITKTKLTLAQAADQWAEAKRAMDAAKPLLEEAAPILLEHFEKTGRKTYKDLVGVRQGVPRTVLDQQAVKEFLGADLPKYQTRSDPKPSLYLL